MKGKILVSDGRSLAALAIIRSFGEKGFEVHCGDDFKNNLSSFSRYVRKRILYPSPTKNPDAFIMNLLKLNEAEKYDLIIPVRDDTTLLLAKNKEYFENTTNLCLAKYEIIKQFRDKGETIKLAIKAGVPVPKTYYPEDNDVKDIKNSVKYPVLIRARISSGSRGIIYVEEQDQFDDAYNEVLNEYGLPIIQEYIDHSGGHYSIGTVFDENSEPVAIHVYKELKQYPINGGPAVTAISIEKEPWVDNFINLLRTIGWQGPAHMDVLYDLSSNEPKLLEINPRFWMSLNLSIQAGVDFPYYLYQLKSGDNIKYIGDYNVGLKYRWVFPNEILWLTQTPDKIKGMKEFINFWDNNTCYGDISTRDPFPLIGIMAQSLDFLLNKEKRKVIFKRGW